MMDSRAAKDTKMTILMMARQIANMKATIEKLQVEQQTVNGSLQALGIGDIFSHFGQMGPISENDHNKLNIRIPHALAMNNSSVSNTYPLNPI